MKFFIQVLDPNDPVFLRAGREIGDAGLWQCHKVVSEAIDLGLEEIDPIFVKNVAGVRADRAEKIFSFCTDILRKTIDHLRLSSDKFRTSIDYLQLSNEDLKLSSEHLQLSKDVDPSNPCGSIKEEKTDRQTEENTTPKRGGRVSQPKRIIPEDWQPSEKCVADLIGKHKVSLEEINFQVEKIKLYSQSKNVLYSDFNQALRHWFISPFYAPKGFNTVTRTVEPSNPMRRFVG